MINRTPFALVAACVFTVACGGASPLGGIKIEKATYAGNCDAPVDRTSAVAASCDGDGCYCDKGCFASETDPAPGCAKDLVVTFNAGAGSDTVTCGPENDESFAFVIEGGRRRVSGPRRGVHSGGQRVRSRRPGERRLLQRILQRERHLRLNARRRARPEDRSGPRSGAGARSPR
jgi:hypothetical protein